MSVSPLGVASRSKQESWDTPGCPNGTFEQNERFNCIRFFAVSQTLPQDESRLLFLRQKHIIL